ncbi:Uu.00g140390.m01.CDS01 [Anthostomella pinea]|uniref:Uu.00g140390.m01.CDS01 n=1 Tax=Anthostomella pinea TaxID=933095 RepID=A0AAI8VR01_9PEZI|nr:Uu.00g140390.m01.CDS01 [Anthostomella pinea]
MAPTVAVIGLGAVGLVTLKNLLEEGFDATGLERNDYLGGLWRFTEKPTISVLKSTCSNGSKQRGCFTDFPYPSDAPDFVPAEQVHEYLLAYARHFHLEKHARLKTSVSSAAWDEKRRKWRLLVTKPESTGPVEEFFDKVVFAMGSDQQPIMPEIPGIEKFAGFTSHSVSFKDPNLLAGKRVMILGFGNTAADMATEVSKCASKVYLAHRNGAIILPRWVNEQPVDHVRTYRKYCILQLMSRYTPSLWTSTMNSVIKKLQHQVFDMNPEWRFEPAPSIINQRPLVSDDLVDKLAAGTIVSTYGLERVLDASTVETSDGKQYEVDAIIFCTGFSVDFSVVGDADPTRATTKAWEETSGSNGRALPRLYQNIFSLDHPDSLAFMGYLSFMNPAFFMFDLASMAVAQLWKGNSAFPPQAEMERQVDQHHAWVCSLAATGSVMPAIVKASDWMDWVSDVAGTNLETYLGYGFAGWSFWFSDRRFCSWLMDGLLSPHMYRLFPGKRKSWAGARDAIIAMNEDRTARFGPMA